MIEKKAKRDTTKKRKSILEAGVKAFQKYGYENTSMDKIAEVANASKRTVYNHFKSKDDLFHAVLDNFVKEITPLKEIRYNPDSPIKDQLSGFVDAEIALVKNKNWLGLKRTLMSVFIRDADLTKKIMAKYGSRQEPLEKWLIAATRDDKLDVKDPKTAAMVFKAMISGSFTWPAVFTGLPPLKTLNNLKAELLETFLCKYGKR